MDGAALIIAESIEAALVAIASGVPQRRVMALALPHERLQLGDETGFAAQVAGAARSVGGLLTDSEVARDSLERAAADCRPIVEVFPPVAADQPCPEVHQEAGYDPAGLHPAAAQLALWRRLIDQESDDGSVDGADSFAAARLLGTVARWPMHSTTAWGTEVALPITPVLAPSRAPAWSAASQVQSARLLWGQHKPPASTTSVRPRPALVGGYDLKFARDLAERLGQRPDLAVVLDDWQTLSRGTPHTIERLRRADSVFAEWARTSAIWYSRHKRPDQFLAIRLHRFELDAQYPHDIAIENVDAIVYIAPLFGRRIRDELGWPKEKLLYIPNYLDLSWLDRPKPAEARFAIGFVGIEWRRKRFDLALDLLARLRREDRRFTLVVRSTMPWHNRYAWSDPAEREYVGRCFERIERDPWLRQAVIFDEPGRDMARWFRQIGHVLSTSDEEGCHTSVGEGMASGAVPIVRPWAGAAEVYGDEWIQPTAEAAARTVLASVDVPVWQERRERVRAEIRRTHDSRAVVDAWAHLLHGDIPQARAYFARYADLGTPVPVAGAPGQRRPASVSPSLDG